MESTYFIDKKSLSLIKFFKTYNVIIAILNAIAIIILCFMITTQKEESKSYLKPKYDSYSEKTYYQEDTETDEKTDTKDPDAIKAVKIFSSLIFGTLYCILTFMIIELLIKHFSNVAESKGIQFEMFKQTEEYGYYVKHLEETKKQLEQ